MPLLSIEEALTIRPSLYLELVVSGPVEAATTELPLMLYGFVGFFAVFGAFWLPVVPLLFNI